VNTEELTTPSSNMLRTLEEEALDAVQ